MMSSFKDEVQEALACYVYRLIDPRTGDTFYVGRGRGNRVFQHVIDEVKLDRKVEDEDSLKLSTIRNIRAAELEVLHIIHRHGLTEDEAKLVEASLIDAYPGLSNEIAGKGSADFGPAHVSQLARRYGTPAFAANHGDKLLLITVNQSFHGSANLDAYEASRCAWRINSQRAKKADCILAIVYGVVRGVFVADVWLPATRENFPRLAEDSRSRKGYIGRPAPIEYQERYLNMRVPEELLKKRGETGPLKYNYL